LQTNIYASGPMTLTVRI